MATSGEGDALQRKGKEAVDEDASSQIISEISRDHEEGRATPVTAEKRSGGASLELTRTTTTMSRTISRVASRMTTRHIVDPGPPPGETPIRKLIETSS